MPTQLVTEGRKHNGNGHASKGHPAAKAQREDDEMNDVLNEIMRLVDACKEGRLSERGKPTLFNGPHREIIHSINEMLDALVVPVEVAATYVDRIGKGDIPPRITETYEGDFNILKNNLNTCIDALNGLIAEMKRMSEEHNRGDIDIVIPADKFEGAYRVMAQGVNEMVAGHIAVKKKAMSCIAEFGREISTLRWSSSPARKRSSTTISSACAPA